jgi:hypothetical protein
MRNGPIDLFHALVSFDVDQRSIHVEQQSTNVHSGCPQNDLGFFNEPPAVGKVDPRISRDSEKSQRHLKGQPARDRAKRPLAIRKVAGVFPKKMADKALRRMFISGRLQKIML